MNKLLTLLSICLIGTTLQAQTPQSDENDLFILSNLDSLTNRFYEKQTYTIDPKYKDIDTTVIPSFTEEEVRIKMEKMISPFPMVYNQYVQNYIKVYAERRRTQVNRMLGLSQYYFPIFEEVLDKMGLPLELKYLAVIESALNPKAISHAGATGLWQMMYATGRMYDLNISSYFDQRMDVYKSTVAGISYLNDLYGLYGDWALAIAAYNCGPGNVNKAIRRSGGSKDFWTLRKYLPRETRGYVPAFIAAAYVFEYHKDYNLIPIKNNLLSLPSDTIYITKTTSVDAVCKYTGIDADHLVYLNPSLKTNIIPALDEPYQLLLPLNYVNKFDRKRDSIYALSAQTNEKALVAAKKTPVKSKPSPKKPYSPPAGKEKIIYKVRTGDNLGQIAEAFDVPIYRLKSWNNIRGSRIRVGQSLKIYVPESKASDYRTIARKGALSVAGGSNAASSIPESFDYSQYTIRSGDTLWEIVKKYPKNTIEDLKQLNNLKSYSVLKPGMVIKIKT